MSEAPADRWSELLASGSSILVGLVRADGSPFVTRGWGVTAPRADGLATVLLGATETASLGPPVFSPVGSTIAVTITEIRTLRAQQLKGPIRAITTANREHLARKREFCRLFIDAVSHFDNASPMLLPRIVPAEIVACDFEVHERYDQTPGPGAGRALEIAP